MAGWHALRPGLVEPSSDVRPARLRPACRWPHQPGFS